MSLNFGLVGLAVYRGCREELSAGHILSIALAGHLFLKACSVLIHSRSLWNRAGFSIEQLKEILSASTSQIKSLQGEVVRPSESEPGAAA